VNEKGSALITGASAGIGKALACEFAAQGHDLILVARSAQQLEVLAQQLSARHDIHCTAMPADLASEAGVEALCAQLLEKNLQVDILVNNAGVMCEGRYWEVPLAKQQQLVQLNIASAASLTHRLLGPMVGRGHGHILNLSSISAYNSIPYLGSYAASKAFVLSFTEALAIELKGTGVTATALCPGFTDTGMIVNKDGSTSKKLPLIPNMTARQVARLGYRAGMGGAPVYIPGWSNRLAVTVSRHQPRWFHRLIFTLRGQRGF
jgi:short-subunit dehydrogenase